MNIESFSWFHDISRLQAENVLRSEENGTYLVRRSESSNDLSLSIRLPESVRHYKIFLNENGYYMEAIPGRSIEFFDSVDRLISWYSVPQRGLKYTLVKPYTLDGSPESKVSEESESDDENTVSEEDTITCFFKQQLDSMYSMLRSDSGMKNMLSDYIDKGVFKDFQKVASGCTKPVLLQELIVECGSEISSALSKYLKRLDLIMQLFDVGTNLQKEEKMKSLKKPIDDNEDFESLLNKISDCQNLVLSLERKACQVFREYSGTSQLQKTGYRSEDIYSIVKDDQPTPSPVAKTSNNKLSSETIMRQFEVTSGPLKSKSYVLQDVKGDKIYFLKHPDDIDNTQGISSQKVLQLIKSNSSKVKLNILLENQSPKSYFFENYKSREVFCQNLQHMKIVYSNDPYASKVSIFVGSWNMGDANAPEDLSDWFRCHGQGKTKPTEFSKIPADIYVIGTQESAYHEKEWINKLSSELKKTFNKEFKTLVCTSLWGIRMIIFIKPELSNQITSLKHSSVKTGIANALGNKGAVGVSFFVGNTSFCFVNSHLASRFERKNRRNQDFNSILRNLNLGPNNVFDLTLSFHHLFWFGDLNYRIDMDITDIIKSVMEKDWKKLIKHDQLSIERDKHTVFNDFEEAELTFPPTYRYKRGDRTCYIWIKEKRRGNLTNVPSWCDRVLWRSYPELASCNTSYGCPTNICTSDHSPVFATFDVDILTHTTPVPDTLPFEKVKPVKIKLMNIEGQIQTRSGSSFVIEFHSTSFEKPFLSKKNSIFNQERKFDSLFRKPNQGGENIHKYPFWASGDLPELLPIISELNYLQDQYILMAVRGEDGNEFYGECVYSMKQFLTGELQEFSCSLMHLGEFTGSLKVKLQMKLPGDYIYKPPLKSNKIYDLISTEDDFGSLPEEDSSALKRLTKLIPIDKAVEIQGNEKMAFDNPCINYPNQMSISEIPQLPPKKNVSRRSSRDSSSSSSGIQSMGSNESKLEKKFSRTESVNDGRPPMPLPRNKKREKDLHTLLSWLKKINQQQYYDVLVTNGFDNLNYFPTITKEDLIAVGITNIEHVTIILTHAAKIKSNSLKGLVQV